jgi:hypothetical protein
MPKLKNRMRGVVVEHGTLSDERRRILDFC